jgi:hypothetical protein
LYITDLPLALMTPTFFTETLPFGEIPNPLPLKVLFAITFLLIATLRICGALRLPFLMMTVPLELMGIPFL